LNDAPNILELYKKVASIYPDNLTQQVDEITLRYVESVLQHANLYGLILLMYKDGNLIGFLKAYTSEFRRKGHILTNATIMIDPTALGEGFSTQLLRTYLGEIQKSWRHIRVMELLPHDSNIRGIRLYERLGFILTATLANQIRYVDGTFGDQLVMTWINPNFCSQALLKYYQYLEKLIHEDYSISSRNSLYTDFHVNTHYNLIKTNNLFERRVF
jgi:RimJ/RimL family protein N-acetyltransferase